MSAAIATETTSRLGARQRVELILGQLDRLPTLPAVAARLLSLTSSDDSDARQIVELIESDPALTTAVLRLVRSADAGVRNAPTVSVARAVTLLGFDAVRSVVLTVQLYEMFTRAEKNDRMGETRKGIWLHSLAVACVAESLAQSLAGRDWAGEAFVCGLLHDIGKIALDACLPKSYARVIDHVQRRCACISDVEQELFGLDHCIAGKRLAVRWGLPQAVIECIWLHHQNPETLPSLVGFRRLIGVVHLADNLVRRDGIGFSGYQHVVSVEDVAKRLGVRAGALTAVMERLPARMEPFRELLGVDDDANRTEYSKSLVTANRHLAALNAKLMEGNRRLEQRSLCLSGLASFLEQVLECHRLADACLAAGETVRKLLNATRAVGFFVDADENLVYLAAAGAAPDRVTPSALDLSTLPANLRYKLPDPAAAPAGPMQAPAGYEEVWRRATETECQQRLWLLPIPINERAKAGVLIDTADEVPGRAAGIPREWPTLSKALGAMMACVQSRCSLERLSEELLELSRRWHAAERDLVRARSLSMIAAMAGGAAHELNNPLSVISGRAQMELERCRDEDTARTLQIIVEQTRRATELVTDLMRFAKPEPPTPILLPLSGVLEPLCQHWRTRASLRDEQLTLRLADEQLTVYADGNQLREMLDAVVANAIEATSRETARLQINSACGISDETVRIIVEDNGMGMSREVLEHALDPFFSSRVAGRGRGLGLTRAYRLAEIQNGRLWIESTPGIGTRVTIELPARSPRA